MKPECCCGTNLDSHCLREVLRPRASIRPIANAAVAHDVRRDEGTWPQPATVLFSSRVMRSALGSLIRRPDHSNVTSRHTTVTTFRRDTDTLAEPPVAAHPGRSANTFSNQGPRSSPHVAKPSY